MSGRVSTSQAPYENSERLDAKFYIQKGKPPATTAQK